MVSSIGKFYQCDICNFKYKEKAMALKCKDWCRKYKNCSMEITKFSVK